MTNIERATHLLDAYRFVFLTISAMRLRVCAIHIHSGNHIHAAKEIRHSPFPNSLLNRLTTGTSGKPGAVSLIIGESFRATFK